MGFFSKFRKKEVRQDIDVKSKTIDQLISEYYDDGGISVSEMSAMTISTFYTCVRIISESISQIPIELYKNVNGVKEKINDNLYNLIHYQPNSFQTSFEFRELMLYKLLTTGNFYGWINWVNGRTKISEILPLLNVKVEVKNWKPIYKANIGGIIYEIPFLDILHVKGLSIDGFTGINPIAYQRKLLGLSLNNIEHANALFKNGGRPTGVLSYPAKLSDKAYENLTKSLQKLVSGKNYGKQIVVEEGAKYQVISLSNADLQFIEMTNLTQENICAIMRVPQHMAGILRRSTNNNIEQQSLEFVKYTLLPWIKRIEQALWRDLLTKKQKDQKYFFNFNLNSLERADMDTRFKSYNIAIMNGILNPNEVRQLEGYNDRAGGDDYLTPLNMRITDENGKIVETTFKKKEKNEESNISVEARHKLREENIKPIMIRANQTVIKETKDVKDAINTYYTEKRKKTNKDFIIWLENYYTSFRGYVFDVFKEFIYKYSESIKKASLLDIIEVKDVDISDDVDKMLKILSLEYSENSLNQLKNIIEESSPETIVDDLNNRLDEWNDENNKARKFAIDKSVEIEGKISRITWGLAAASVEKNVLYKWNTKGESCPYCNSLNGKIVGKEGNFVEPGTTISVSEGQMKIYSGKLHAPLHRSCDCYISPIFTSI